MHQQAVRDLAAKLESLGHEVEEVQIPWRNDQAMLACRLAAFGETVNVTLGLPFVRTSVDHGTAYDIAGKGLADPRGMISAWRLAVRLIELRGRARAT